MAELGRTYTPPGGAGAGRIATLTDQVTSEIQGAPVARQQMGEQMMAEEGQIPALSAERGKLIEQLFQADQQMASKYAQPGGEYYIEDPGAREAITSRVSGTLWGNIGNINQQISARKQVLGDALDRGMAIYEAGIKAKQTELDNLFKLLSVQQQMSTQAQKQSAVIDPKKQGALMTMEVMFDQLAKKSAGKSLGKWKGTVAEKALSFLGPESNSFLRELKEFKDLRYGLASQIARAIAGESGVLNEADIQRALGLLPDIYDVAETRANKLASLRQFMDSKWEGALMPTYAGEPVQGMPIHLARKFQYVYGQNGGMNPGYYGGLEQQPEQTATLVGANDWVLAE